MPLSYLKICLIRWLFFFQNQIGRKIKITVKIRWTYAQMCCAVSQICASISSHRICKFWARSEQVNMPKTIESPPNVKFLLQFDFFIRRGAMQRKFTDEWVMCTAKLSWVTAKCGNSAETLNVCTSCVKVPAPLSHFCHPWKVHSTH